MDSEKFSANNGEQQNNGAQWGSVANMADSFNAQATPVEAAEQELCEVIDTFEVGEGLPPKEESFKKITGEDWPGVNYKAESHGVDDDGYDNPIETYTVYKVEPKEENPTQAEQEVKEPVKLLPEIEADLNDKLADIKRWRERNRINAWRKDPEIMNKPIDYFDKMEEAVKDAAITANKKRLEQLAAEQATNQAFNQASNQAAEQASNQAAGQTVNQATAQAAELAVNQVADQTIGVESSKTAEIESAEATELKNAETAEIKADKKEELQSNKNVDGDKPNNLESSDEDLFGFIIPPATPEVANHNAVPAEATPKTPESNESDNEAFNELLVSLNAIDQKKKDLEGQNKELQKRKNLLYRIGAKILSFFARKNPTKPTSVSPSATSVESPATYTTVEQSTEDVAPESQDNKPESGIDFTKSYNEEQFDFWNKIGQEGVDILTDPGELTEEKNSEINEFWNRASSDGEVVNGIKRLRYKMGPSFRTWLINHRLISNATIDQGYTIIEENDNDNKKAEKEQIINEKLNDLKDDYHFWTAIGKTGVRFLDSTEPLNRNSGEEMFNWWRSLDPSVKNKLRNMDFPVGNSKAGRALREFISATDQFQGR